MSWSRPSAGALVLFAAVLGSAACDTDDGRALRAPPPGATAPPLTSSTTGPVDVLGTPQVGSGAPTEELVLTSPAFPTGGAIPVQFSCDGAGVSPPLSWSGVPASTAELVLSVVDLDVAGPPFVHWLVVGIDPTVTGVGEGGLPETAVEVSPWTGPCPPPGESHDYQFTLYALSSPTGIAPGTSVDDAMAVVESTPGPATFVAASYSPAPGGGP
jgi:Raf kinase inhibitor-like YbhB/YbcL family protein